MATTQDIVTGALRLLGVGAGDETPATEDSAIGLYALNELLNSWNAQHWSVYTIVNRQKVLTPGTGSYTIGTGGAINVARPVKIESAGIIQPGGLRTDLAIVPSAGWAKIPEKTAQAKQPLHLYNDGDYPLSKLYLWPAPANASTLDLYVWDELTEPLALDDDLELPPAYERCVRFNLALSLAPEFGRKAEDIPVVVQIAQSAKAELFGLNQSNSAGTEDPPQPAAQ